MYFLPKVKKCTTQNLLAFEGSQKHNGGLTLTMFIKTRNLVPLPQARRHTGGHTGAVPPQLTACAPQTKIVPPKRGLCPEEINRFGALERKSRPKLVLFADLKLEKPLEIPISAGKTT